MAIFHLEIFPLESVRVAKHNIVWTLQIWYWKRSCDSWFYPIEFYMVRYLTCESFEETFWFLEITSLEDNNYFATSLSDNIQLDCQYDGSCYS